VSIDHLAGMRHEWSIRVQPFSTIAPSKE
jgi:hypothetical protein